MFLYATLPFSSRAALWDSDPLSLKIVKVV